MGDRRRRRVLVSVVTTVAVAVASGCAGAPGHDQGRALERASATAPTTVPSAPAPNIAPATTAPPPSTTPPASGWAVPAATPPTTLPPASTIPVATPREVHEQSWTPFAAVGPVVLHHPSARVERVGFHESNHDGARELEPLPTAAAPLVLETRERGTGLRSAADVVVDPELEVRSPVTGTVVRAGTYVLYCRHSDDYAVVEPDDRPGWEVKVLHIDGVRVRRGQRVVAGETVLAPRPTVLPFESQVDETTARPAWPHVHLEVVDPSIPDRPSEGGGC